MIEAAVENEHIKREIFEKLCPVLQDKALICTNTSSISVTALAAHTDRPERFMGMHFMNPVPVMRLVELIRALTTSDATYSAIKGVVAKLGKTGVTSQDYPAFIVNRVLLPMINEAIFALHEGIGDIASIDTAMKLGANMPMGPSGTRRFHRPRRMLEYHARALRRHRRTPNIVRALCSLNASRRAGSAVSLAAGFTTIKSGHLLRIIVY